MKVMMELLSVHTSSQVCVLITAFVFPLHTDKQITIPSCMIILLATVHKLKKVNPHLFIFGLCLV